MEIGSTANTITQRVVKNQVSFFLSTKITKKYFIIQLILSPFDHILQINYISVNNGHDN